MSLSRDSLVNRTECNHGHKMPEHLGYKRPWKNHPNGLYYCIICRRKTDREASRKRREKAKAAQPGKEKALGARQIFVQLDCGHEAQYPSPAPLIGGAAYCPWCQDWSVTQGTRIAYSEEVKR